MRTLAFLLIASGLLLLVSIFWVRSAYPRSHVFYAEPASTGLWHFQAIDTMKYSRDVAREHLGDPSFDIVIERQVKAIADTGATHIAIATPYDEEFIPFLTRWVKSARTHGLSVWFRGNFSGWEGWFGYPRITREEHLRKTKEFILTHADLFADGDAFSSCPECENGGAGDPRKTGDVTRYRAFLISEYGAMQEAFKKIDRHVTTNYFSMNGDVARLIMDQATTKELGGVVTIDHYVKTPKELASDIRDIAKRSGGKVMLGEFGAPIPDIHGKLSGAEQAKWIEGALAELAKIPELVGVSYWLSVGGSTALWTDSGEASPAVAIVSKYFQSRIFFGRVFDDLGRAVPEARVQIRDRVTTTNTDGYFELALPDFQPEDALVVGKAGYTERILSLKTGNIREVIIEKQDKSLFESIAAFWNRTLGEI